MSTFTCYIGSCKKSVRCSPYDVAEHVKNFHPALFRAIKSERLYTCNTCRLYTKSIHFHCNQCEMVHFNSQEVLIAHLKEVHPLWHLEHDCKYGVECHGVSGGCGFNHHTIGKLNINGVEPIPEMVCKNDRPWDGVRCHSLFCKYDHFWGRVRYLINARNKQNESSAAEPSVLAVERDSVKEEVAITMSPAVLGHVVVQMAGTQVTPEQVVIQIE